MGSKIKIFLKAGLLAAVPLFLFGALWLWSGESKASPLSANSGIILFFGKECPHCQDLEETIEKEGFSDKVSFDSLEIWHNRGNRKIFSEKFSDCG